MLCRECFIWCFEEEIHWTITNNNLLNRGDRVAIGASGGKGNNIFALLSFKSNSDSTVLAYVMKLLNERYDYGVEFILLSIDEGIAGYRDDSLEARFIKYTFYLLFYSSILTPILVISDSETKSVAIRSAPQDSLIQ